MFSSDRHFFLVGYQASHGLLLFRSPKGHDGATTRIDVLFQDVRAIELRAWTDGLTIEEVAPETIADMPSRPTALIEPGNRVYALRGGGWEGFVVGGIVRTAEDELEIGEPTELIAASDPQGIGIR
jgi:hypothetical protein